MIALLRTLAIAAIEYGVAETLLRGQGARRRLGRIISGVALLAVAAGLGGVTLVFLLASLFFTLAEQSAWVMPALVTALAGAAVALVLAWEGTRRIKK